MIYFSNGLIKCTAPVVVVIWEKIMHVAGGIKNNTYFHSSPITEGFLKTILYIKSACEYDT